MNQEISNEKVVIKEVLNDLSTLISINKKYFACEWNQTDDEERNHLLNELNEIRTRTKYQFIIHAEVVEPEQNGQSEEWATLQEYFLHYFNSPVRMSIPSFDAYKKGLRPDGLGGK